MNAYGVREVNGLDGHKLPEIDESVGPIPWTEQGLYITRLRLISDVGLPFYDVSYCHGTWKGKYVRVQLPFNQLPKRGLRSEIVKYAKRDHVFAQRTGILENISTLN